MRGTGGGHLGVGCLLLTLATQDCRHSHQKLPTTWGHWGDTSSPLTRFTPLADYTTNNSYVPTTLVGKVLLLLPLNK